MMAANIAALHHLLRTAYSAERAAALAYRGHAGSVRDPGERARIRNIEAEEWQHRAEALRMLTRLGQQPSRWLEWKFGLIGRVIALSCYVIGHFLPMYFAGRLESANVNEYLRLIVLSAGTTIADETACLRRMAKVEKEHEVYLLSRIARHRLLPLFQVVFRWGPGASFNPLPAVEEAP